MTQVYYPLSTSKVSEWPGTRPAGWAYHVGTDFAVPTGTPVPATANGRIVFVGNDGLGGFTIDLVDDGGLTHRFGHLTWNSNRVSVGSRVSAGQIIALSGNSGMSTGPHLHWELRWDRLWTGGNWVDPSKIGAKQFGASTTPAKPKPKPTTPTTTGKKNDMAYSCVMKKLPGNRGYWAKIFDLTTGEEHNFETSNLQYIKNVAATYGCGPTSIITESHFNAIRKELEATRARLDKRK